MRSGLYYNNFIIIFFLLFLISSNNLLSAQNTMDEKIKNISLQLRCMTCQNQSIYDSDADFSKDLKKIIRKQIIEGRTEDEIIDFLIARYGEYIVFKPLINYKNIFLWVFPFALFVVSLLLLALRLKKNNI